jgi:hypothetical protein
MKYADSQIDDASSPQPLKLEILTSNESSVYKQESNSINYPKIDENNDN